MGLYQFNGIVKTSIEMYTSSDPQRAIDAENLQLVLSLSSPLLQIIF